LISSKIPAKYGVFSTKKPIFEKFEVEYLPLSGLGVILSPKFRI
jgi:hypothetical protein